MAANRSTALLEAVAESLSYYHILKNGRIKYYTGARPASADDAPTGTLLGTFTKGGGTYTAETRATGVIVFSVDAGTPAVSALTVGGISLISSTVTSDGTIADLVVDLAAAINAYDGIPKFTATTNSTDTVTIYGPVGMGARINGCTIAITAAEVTATINGGSSTTMGGTGATAGVTAANGCGFQYPSADGVLTKETTAWQMTAVASGTVGYARWEFDGADNQSSSTTYRRMDLTVGTSGADLNVGTTTITSGQTYTIDTGTYTVPEA